MRISEMDNAIVINDLDVKSMVAESVASGTDIERDPAQQGGYRHQR